MRKTLDQNPGRFWYLNNGITIVCDAVSLESEGGAHRITLTNPQVINGQQTTYALAASRKGASKARVSVRAIGLPRGDQPADWKAYEEMVASVVRATNSQNQITQSDLRSNDRLQVHIERELHKRNYHYVRKRAAPSERGGQQYEWGLSKFDVAKAVMTCEAGTVVHNEGREVLFADRYYEGIFDRPIDRLLTHLWFYRSVDGLARGRAEWQAAKYVACEFMWDEFSPFVLQHQRHFIEMSETWDP